MDNSTESVPVRKVIPQEILNAFDTLRKACLEKMSTDPPAQIDGLYCNRTVDNWGGCWPDTPANTTAIIACPQIPTLKTHEQAFSRCSENGTWEVHPHTGAIFFDYLQCMVKSDEMEDATQSIYIFIGGFSVSLILLVLSLFIFLRFKQLRCDRITIHKHLFLSYMLTGISWILYYMLVVSNGGVLLENSIWCRVLHVVCHYFTVCNFFWMFCEGLYLNTVMVYAMTSSHKLIVVCYIIGWGFPFVLAGIYTTVRNNKQEAAVACWFHESDLQFIMLGPIIASIVINAAFLANIVRLLVTKLRQLPEVAQTKKATRAALILVPLLGLQFLLLPFRPAAGSAFDDAYHILIALLTSLGGAFVSLVYCFCNGEVISVMTRKYKQHRLMRKRSSMKSTQGLGYTSLYQLQINVNGNTSANKVSDDVECSTLDKDSI